MPDDQQELRRINWGEAFPFTHLFRSFRLAVHPSKLLLVLVAVLLTYCLGNVMDAIWPKAIVLTVSERPMSTLVPGLMPSRMETTEVQAFIDCRGGKKFCQWRSDTRKLAEACSKTKPSKEGPQATERGIFRTLFAHERSAFHSAVRALLTLNFGMNTVPPSGLKNALVNAMGGIVWFYCAHWFYAVVFTVIALLIWSLFGGAVCRIAALHAARDEKIAIKQALRFSGRKLFSFFSAPLIPIALVCVIGAVVFLGGLFCAIPYLGEIVAGLLWPLALFGGFIMVLVMVGAVGGFMLMFPTVAVEGSDSFDALSRSFSYVYSKPWRTSFYVLVSGIYGSICYLFVRLFAHLVLNATHMAAGLGMNVDGSGKNAAVGKLDAIWQRTAILEPGRFFGEFGLGTGTLNGSETFAAFFIAVWTFIVVGLVASFVISFFFSSSTLIYYLLRREVDATDIEDVYLEEYEEETLAPAAAPTPAAEKPAEPPKTEAPAPTEGQTPPAPAGGEGT